jgi:hypothetical protein
MVYVYHQPGTQSAKGPGTWLSGIPSTKKKQNPEINPQNAIENIAQITQMINASHNP